MARNQSLSGKWLSANTVPALRPALTAQPQAASQPPRIGGPAAWAGEAVGPAQPGQILRTGFLGAEASREFGQGLGIILIHPETTTAWGWLSQGDTPFFKIGTSGTGAPTGTGLTVVMTSGETCNNNVFWWTAEAATLTDSVFIGSILAGTSITVTRGSLDGQALATVAVTLTGTTVYDCGNVSLPAKPKANEGLGNGVDGNTPGDAHNGQNDTPAVPGSPGAKNK